LPLHAALAYRLIFLRRERIEFPQFLSKPTALWRARSTPLLEARTAIVILLLRTTGLPEIVRSLAARSAHLPTLDRHLTPDIVRGEQTLHHAAVTCRLLRGNLERDGSKSPARARPADSGCTCGEALRTRQRAIATDVETCAFMAGTPDREAHLQAGMRAAQSTPLISRDGRLLGMLSAHWRQPHHPGESELRRFDILARQAADVIERAQTTAALRESETRFRVQVEASARQPR
jgi:GAF domain-containing protein